MEPASAEHTLELLGWVLLHFLWQGALLGALFWCANFILRHRSANARYVAGSATLLMMAAAPAMTLSILLATADRDSSGLLLSSEQVEQFLAMPFRSGGAADLGGRAVPDGHHLGALRRPSLRAAHEVGRARDREQHRRDQQPAPQVAVVGEPARALERRLALAGDRREEDE